MSHILLDSYPLALISTPIQIGSAADVSNWVTTCLRNGHRLYIPEIIDYELRRELVRSGKSRSVTKLDSLRRILRFLPINSDAMLLASSLWAESRNIGRPTGDPKKIDIDVILAAQAITLDVPVSEVIIATSNASHLSQFVTAKDWYLI